MKKGPEFYKKKKSLSNRDKKHNIQNNFCESEIYKSELKNPAINSLNTNEKNQYLSEIKQIFKILGKNNERIKVPYLEVKSFTQILNQIRLLIEENIQNYQLIGKSTDYDSNLNFEKIKNDILSESEKYDDVIKLKANNIVLEKKLNNFEKDLILKNEVIKEKLNTLCILEIEKTCLREQMISLEEKNDKITIENERNIKILNQLKDDLENCQKTLNKNEFELENIKKISKVKLNENNLLKSKFSIIANVRHEFPNRNLSMISHDFLDLNTLSNRSSISNFSSLDKDEKKKSISIRRLSKNLFSQNKQQSGISNFKDFLIAQVSNNSSINNENNQNNNLLSIKIPLLEENQRKSLIEENKSLEPFIKKSLLNKYKPSKDIIIEEHSKEKDCYYTLETQEDYKIFVDEIREESQKNIDNLTKKLKFFQCKIKKLQVYCQKMRLENLEIIKLKYKNEKLKKKIFNKQIKDIEINKIADKKVQTNFEEKKFANWGIQTENNKNIKISFPQKIFPILTKVKKKKVTKKKEIHYFDLNDKDIVNKISNYQLFNTIFLHLQNKIHNLKKQKDKNFQKVNNLEKYSHNSSKWKFKLKPSENLHKIKSKKQEINNFKIKFFDKDKELASLFINYGSNN